MSGGFDNHSIHHHHHHFLRQKSIFLPMLCRLSIKDIKLNRRRNDPTFSDEPSSPKVSCMGNVKRNNRVTGLPPPGRAASSPVTTHNHKYSKLKKLFSSKALLPSAPSSLPPAAAAAVGGRSKSCRSSKGVRVDDLRRLNVKKECEEECEEECVKIVNVGELDPPLPVVKREAAPPGDGVNLWKRRFEGAALKNLQIQQINLQIRNLKPPTV